MQTAEEYRRHAQECLQLAKEAKELDAKQTMMELAAEFSKAAEALERNRVSIS